MQDISVSVAGGKVQLDCGSFKLTDDVIAEKVRAVTALLAQLLLADHAKALLEDVALQQRQMGIAAQDMIVQASILHAVNQAEILLGVTSGRLSIAASGFPEFQSDRTIDV